MQSAVFFKKLNLVLVSGLSIVLLFTFPFYNSWFRTKIIASGINFPSTGLTMDIEARKEFKYGEPYLFYRNVARALQARKDNTVVLLPPDAYLTAQHCQILKNMAEPAVFYYFTGLRSVTINSPEVNAANKALIMARQKLFIANIKTSTYRDSLIRLFRNYNQ